MSKFTVNEASQRLLNYGFKLSYLDLQAIGNGGQKTLFTLPAGSGVLACVVQETVAFVGTTSLVIDVGTAGADPDEFINALDVDAMTVPVANTGDLFVQVAGNTTTLAGALPAGLRATAADVLLEVTDSAIASATAGEITVSFLVLDFSNI
jgi:hypothetical protein